MHPLPIDDHHYEVLDDEQGVPYVYVLWRIFECFGPPCRVPLYIGATIRIWRRLEDHRYKAQYVDTRFRRDYTWRILVPPHNLHGIERALQHYLRPPLCGLHLTRSGVSTEDRDRIRDHLGLTVARGIRDWPWT